MQHHRSIGLTDLVALMAAHRAATRVPAEPGRLDGRDAARISASLWNGEPPPHGRVVDAGPVTPPRCTAAGADQRR